MTVSYLDPTAEEGIEAEPYELFIDTQQPITIGLVANSFPDGTEFMDKLELVLNSDLPNAAIRRYQKPSVLPVTEEQLEAITSECDAVIAAWGH